MNRRALLMGLIITVISVASAARADFADEVVTTLRGQGYVDIEVARTLLGRVRILATANWGTRELILNPRTGEILRDILTDPQGNVLPVTGVVASGGPPAAGGTHSGTGGGEDDGSNDDSGHGGDYGSDDDSSGHGGGGDEGGDKAEDEHSGHGG